ncbi:MAG: hypothetical protein U0793_15650 [Gemmataceae bacterium]
MLPLFAATLFVSATLLFLVQPMIGKMILPRLGGTPAVWNTCMVFFQAVLLAGYAYTHTLNSFPRRRQVVVQLLLLACPFLVLPFALGAWTPPAEQNPVLSVLWLLLGLVGLPFFVVSTSAPLLQRWFATTDHPAAKDPYFLYGASNLGSLLALMLYPLAVEPLFAITEQTWVWTIGYGVFVLLVVVCAGVVARSRGEPRLALASAPPPLAPPQPTEQSSAAIQTKPRRLLVFAQPKTLEAPAERPTPRDRITPLRRLRWIGLAAVPSSLMLGMTSYLTTDIAAIPFFWVIPLALYLLTFILVFARWPVVWTETVHPVIVYAQPCFVMFLFVSMIGAFTFPISIWFLIHGAAFFFTALLCHGELARDRPDPRHLTEFYLWLSVGGVLGGLFNALFAPLVFKTGAIEYPAAFVLAFLLRPTLVGKETLFPGDSNDFEKTSLGKLLDFLVPVAIGLIALAGLFWAHNMNTRRIALALPVMLTLALLCRPLRLGLSLAALLSTVALYDQADSPFIFMDRGFFGFVKVREDYAIYRNSEGEETKREKYHTLVHGGINHGMQSMDPDRRRLPITYFHPDSGIGQMFQDMSPFGDLIRESDARLPAAAVALATDPFSSLVNLHSEPPYAVVGLGIGTLAAHARPLQHVDFYEIDPLIRRLSVPDHADQQELFFYVKDAKDRGARVDIVMGDGRLLIEKQAPASFYHVIVLDAFSSDAIPVHLLTADAIDLYLEKLVPGGILIFNATNRYVDLTSVLADIAHDRRLNCFWYGNSGDDTPNKYPSDWVVLQRKDFDQKATGRQPLADRLRAAKAEWRIPRPSGYPAWTDRFSNLLRVIQWGGANG